MSRDADVVGWLSMWRDRVGLTGLGPGFDVGVLLLVG